MECVTLEFFRVGPTDPLAPEAAPLVRAGLELGHRWVLVLGIRDLCGWHPDRLVQTLWAAEAAQGYTDAAEWLRLHEESAK